MITIGITGGIGSGKSTVSSIFSVLHIPTYIADIESKKLTATSPIIKEKLIALFGDSLYKNDALDKQLLASYIFTNKANLEAVNAIIHPEVDKHFCNWINAHSNSPLVAVEAAILFESGMDRFVDKIITVYTPIEERIKRVMSRDNVSKDKVLERINSQMSDEEKISRSDFVIYNDNSKSLISQVLTIIDSISK